MVGTDDRDDILSEIHACRPGPYCFSHVLSDLTVVVDPAHLGNGVGRILFEAFLRIVANEHNDITRVELIARQSNHKALNIYKSLGFREEGLLKSRIKNPDGSLEADVPMAWLIDRTNDGPEQQSS